MPETSRKLILTFRDKSENYALNISARSKIMHKFFEVVSRGNHAPILEGPFKGLEAFVLDPNSGLYLDGIVLDQLDSFALIDQNTGYANLSWLRLTTLNTGFTARVLGLCAENTRATYRRKINAAIDMLYRSYMQPFSGGIDIRFDSSMPGQTFASNASGNMPSTDEEPF
jgi:hypothetical protein